MYRQFQLEMNIRKSIDYVKNWTLKHRFPKDNIFRELAIPKVSETKSSSWKIL